MSNKTLPQFGALSAISDSNLFAAYNSDLGYWTGTQVKTYLNFIVRVPVTSLTQTLATNSAYYINASGLAVLTLPTSANLGDIILIRGFSASGWQIVQGTGQTIHFGISTTTTGTGGSLLSTNNTDSLALECVAANTDFLVTSSIGNISVV